MAAIKYTSIILFVLFLSACAEVELAPRKNPRLSAATVQKIDPVSVRFAAKVYDYGTQEVVEYGFVYNDKPTPRVGDGITISRAGKPDDFFELETAHTMVPGRKYLLVAFMRTTNGITYSGIVEFVNQR
ncbi:hypothetical protein C943_02281 [Mariniradius saccharolyticus AK6]|uniref:Uncharacterized protein n=1 Tax=Mariniradius saccharolyticus AK6 TaxID=1239962 RepID=M7YDG3_9BACT|nr:hypothetical protein [Mariniradius saccharolyticus]EMS35206.1 hypothetical protein C943_02281 [Mariniradius saccharolyticus AK6]